ncbi:hypothetical protein JCM10450v2_008170 [Rhodotorula kratochvilovae]
MSRHEISLSHVKEAVREARETWRNVLSPKLPHDYASSLIKIASLRIQGLHGIAALRQAKHATTYASFIGTEEGRLVENVLPRQIQAAMELPDWLKAKVLQAQDEKLTDQEHKKLYEEGEEAPDSPPG